MAWTQHGKCESDTAALCKSNSKPLAAWHGRGTAWARHAVCELAFSVRSFALFTVDHLSKYLAMRLTLDLDSELPETYRLLNFCIYIAPTPGQLVVLSGNQTLRQVNDKFWKVNKPLEMFYSWKKS